MWIEAHLPSHEAQSLADGAAGVATILANPDIRFPVVLSRIGPTVNESTRTQKIWLTPNATSLIPQLRAGALMTVNLPVGSPTLTLVIPSSAILRDGLHYFSFVQKSDGYVERRRLRSVNRMAPIRKLLRVSKVGELVVTTADASYRRPLHP